MANAGLIKERREVEIELSAANTLTKGEIDIPISLGEEAILIHEYGVEWSDPFEAVADADIRLVQFSKTAESGEITFSDRNLLHKFKQRLTVEAAPSQHIEECVQREHRHFPDPYSKSKIYVAALTASFAAAITVIAFIEYSVIKPSPKTMARINALM